jgi:polysaccharide export outer membrane protein
MLCETSIVERGLKLGQKRVRCGQVLVLFCAKIKHYYQGLTANFSCIPKLSFLPLSFGRRLRLFASVSLTVAISGCAWAPGTYLVHRPSASAEFNFVNLRAVTSDQLEKIAERPGVQGVILEELFEVKPQAYQLGVGDVISFSYWGLPEFSPSLGANQSAAAVIGHTVEPDGTIFLPYAGTVRVAGMTLAQAREAIGQRLLGVVKDPQFDFRVMTYSSQKVVVSGQVRQPGAVFITNQPLDLMTAIGRAGGFAPEGDTQAVLLFRKDKRILIDLDVLIAKGLNPALVYLQDGDLIQVEDRRLTRRAYVTGEMVRNFPVSVSARYSLADAITDAGGALQLSSNGDFYVIRSGAEKPTVFYISLDSPQGASLATRMMLKPGDVVYAGAADLARFNRLLSSFFPGLGAVRQFQDIDYNQDRNNR